jgi:hypothetical protein
VFELQHFDPSVNQNSRAPVDMKLRTQKDGCLQTRPYMVPDLCRAESWVLVIGYHLQYLLLSAVGWMFGNGQPTHTHKRRLSTLYLLDSS